MLFPKLIKKFQKLKCLRRNRHLPIFITSYLEKTTEY